MEMEPNLLKLDQWKRPKPKFLENQRISLKIEPEVFLEKIELRPKVPFEIRTCYRLWNCRFQKTFCPGLMDYLFLGAMHLIDLKNLWKYLKPKLSKIQRISLKTGPRFWKKKKNNLE